MFENWGSGTVLKLSIWVLWGRPQASGVASRRRVLRTPNLYYSHDRVRSWQITPDDVTS